MKRRILDFVVIPLLACCLGYGMYWLTQPAVVPVPLDSRSKSYKGEPVALNVGPEVVAGFGGEVHPLLHGQTKLELTAHWAKVGNGKYVSQMLAQDLCQFFLQLKPAQNQKTYTERDFSAFLPETLGSVGQMWTLDPVKVRDLLCQFHPSPSMDLRAQGRRVGPDGAFAILRAASPGYLDIAFRLHAEFDVTPHVSKEWISGNGPVAQTWYTPAYLAGEMIVSRETGCVEYFRVALPTDKTLNVHLTVKIRSDFGADAHDIVRVDRMELLGGNSAFLTKELAPKDTIPYADAHQKLQRQFYKFSEIDWLPFEQVSAAARDKNKPILAVVLWGALDDQSC